MHVSNDHGLPCYGNVVWYMRADVSEVLPASCTLNLILLIILICVAKFTASTKNIISCKSSSFVLFKKVSFLLHL